MENLWERLAWSTLFLWGAMTRSLGHGSEMRSLVTLAQRDRLALSAYCCQAIVTGEKEKKSIASGLCQNRFDDVCFFSTGQSLIESLILECQSPMIDP